MNRFFNTVLLFFIFPTMLLTIFVGFDIPVKLFRINTTGAELPFKKEAFFALGIIFLLINVRRSYRRWMGLYMINQVKRFKWNAPVSKSRLRRVQVYNLLEAFIMLFVGSALFKITHEALAPASALWFCAFDNVVFTIFGSMKDRYRSGITSKAVMVADREVYVIYFKGLRKVTIMQQSIYFDYIQDVQLSFPVDCIEEGEKEHFFQVLEDQLDTDKVFITKKING